MLNTTFAGGQLKIQMSDALKKQVGQYGINHEEVYRLIESFANKLLAEKYSGEFFLQNEDTGASLRLDLKWETETDVLIEVLEVDMAKVKKDNLSSVPKGAKFDFGAAPQN